MMGNVEMNAKVTDDLNAAWQTVCREDDLLSGTGVCVLYAAKGSDTQASNEEQVAIFKLSKTGEVFAVSNYDPIGKANVMSRGMTGSIGDALVVASPLYKQHFDLKTGQCLENPEVSLSVYLIRIENGAVQISS
ncbi:nitrite reductase small subunit NirD [Marinibactrum halimedae]|uniref:Nitrite reductase small subunit n=1 Tax=Marinibactrum halimedae TaxID=1444977 RepID=A0AA37T640_9GAMM|nr:nitrite reductase small subunit NirD [Marinibactrum halimedae]MCD9458715.1 nitrite reductase small subunit NirD [Marinibactrum halimedae]GLS25918.1 nitrite reductase small subunit [Marinibactrum halimedae]